MAQMAYLWLLVEPNNEVHSHLNPELSPCAPSCNLVSEAAFASWAHSHHQHLPSPCFCASPRRAGAQRGKSVLLDVRLLLNQLLQTPQGNASHRRSTSPTHCAENSCRKSISPASQQPHTHPDTSRDPQHVCAVPETESLHTKHEANTPREARAKAKAHESLQKCGRAPGLAASGQQLDWLG